MNYDWIKKGRIFIADNQFDWMAVYSSPLTGIFINKELYRIYFTTRGKADADGNFISRISFLDINLNNPKDVLYLHDKPVLDIGKPGSFDENGTMIAETIRYNDSIYMYYMGWKRGVNVPYYITLGLAISHDNGITFSKVSEGPVIGQSKDVPYGIGNVSVFIEDDIWKMYYTHYTGWIKKNDIYNPNYMIKYASSQDGITWEFPDVNCITPLYPEENIATPCVIKNYEEYLMWYSYREAFDQSGAKGGYSIGFAESFDGMNWQRLDKIGGLNKSEEDTWDSEMVCYPHVIKYKNKILMFYCGNLYGRDGFGYAELLTQ